MIQQREKTYSFEYALLAERERLVRLCAHLSNNTQNAEDLAQETLLEAWRNRHKVYDYNGLSSWLSAIARIVCLRWTHKHASEKLQLIQPEDEEDTSTPGTEGEWLIDDGASIDYELERSELADLLDRAMALLPPETRTALVNHYIEDLPQAEIASRLGISEGTLGVRLHRGRLALQRILSTEYKQELDTYDMHIATSTGWQQTPLWCFQCGQQRLLGRLSASQRQFVLRCTRCDCEPEGYTINHVAYQTDQAQIFTGNQGYKRALKQLRKWSHLYYQQGLQDRTVVCMKCGRIAPLYMGIPADAPISAQESCGVHVECVCQPINFQTLSSFALALPEGERFSRAHPRIRTLPELLIERDGREVLVKCFESITEAAALDVLFVRDTLEVVCAITQGYQD